MDPSFAAVDTAEDAYQAGTLSFRTRLKDSVGFRHWESPFAGLYFTNEGADPDGVAMDSAPELGTSELCAEMAEVYAMALVRDMEFADLEDPATEISNSAVKNGDGSKVTVSDLVETLNKLNWFSGSANQQTPVARGRIDDRRRARHEQGMNALTVAALFRGSVPGAKEGNYISDFLTMGIDHVGKVPFGVNTISQEVEVVQEGLDYMTNIDVAPSDPPSILRVLWLFASSGHALMRRLKFHTASYHQGWCEV